MASSTVFSPTTDPLPRVANISPITSDVEIKRRLMYRQSRSALGSPAAPLHWCVAIAKRCSHHHGVDITGQMLEAILKLT
jgi:hypothetical protein